MRLSTPVSSVLTKDNRARLDRLILSLSNSKDLYDESAEAELLDWCFHDKDIFEALKKRKHDTTMSAEVRSQLQNIVVVIRSRKNDQLE